MRKKLGSYLLSPMDNWDRYLGPLANRVSPVLSKELKTIVTEARAPGSDWSDRWAAIGAIVMAFHGGLLHMATAKQFVLDAQEIYRSLEDDEDFEAEALRDRGDRKMFEMVGDELNDLEIGGVMIGPRIFD